jgi:hypothetical protein
MSEIELQIVTRVLSGPVDSERPEPSRTVGKPLTNERHAGAGDVEVPGLAALEAGPPTKAGGDV